MTGCNHSEFSMLLSFAFEGQLLQCDMTGTQARVGERKENCLCFVFLRESRDRVDAELFQLFTETLRSFYAHIHV